MTTHQIHKGDARKLSLKDLSVDMILTDPPYNISKSDIAVQRGDDKKYKGTPLTSDFGEWDYFENEEDYIRFNGNWIGECSRVLKFGGHMVVFFDMFRMRYILEYASSYGLIPRQFIFWRKTNPVPRGAMVDFMSAIEVMLWMTKLPRENCTFNYKLGQQHNVIEAPIPGHTTKEDGGRVHTTQKPIKIARILISYLSNKGDTILDPFCGSGWANIAAKKLGRNSIGYDIREKCINDTNERLSRVHELEEVDGYNQDTFRI